MRRTLELLRNILLIAGMLGIIVGGAFKIVAESDDDLHRVSQKVVGLGLAYLGLAILVENLG
jgi:hypothetical protein